MGIHEDFAAYSVDGLVSGSKNPDSPSGNAILYTAEKLFILQMNKSLRLTDEQEFVESIKKQCQIIPGLFCRARNWTDQEGPDDYVGLAAASKLIEASFAQDILNYGRNSRFVWGPFRFKYYYENENPYNLRDGRAWLGRQPQLIAHFEYGAGEQPPILRRLWWFLVVASTGLFNSKNQDTWILSWLLLKTVDRYSLLGKLAEKIWRKRLIKTWGSMKNVFAAYFGDAEHPIAKYCLE